LRNWKFSFTPLVDRTRAPLTQLDERVIGLQLPVTAADGTDDQTRRTHLKHAVLTECWRDAASTTARRYCCSSWSWAAWIDAAASCCSLSSVPNPDTQWYYRPIMRISWETDSSHTSSNLQHNFWWKYTPTAVNPSNQSSTAPQSSSLYRSHGLYRLELFGNLHMQNLAVLFNRCG